MTLLRLCLLCALLLSACGPLPSIVGEPKFQADALVGADTWSLTNVTLRPSLRQALHTREIMGLFDRPAADAGVDLHRLPTPSGRVVDFERDVLPHLDGEVVVAFSGPADEPDVILLVHTNDVEGMLELLSEEDAPRVSRDARGVTRDEASAGPGFVGYKNWLVYTESGALRDQVLDRIDGKGTPSLASEPRYRSVVNRLKGDRLGYGYLDLAPVLQRAVEEHARVGSALQSSGRLAYAFGFEPAVDAGVHALGVRFEFIPDAAPTMPIPRDGDTLQAMDRLPRASMVAFAGPDLGIYAGSVGELTEDEEVRAAVDALLGQFAGPYAFGVTTPPGQQRVLDEGSFGEAVANMIGGVFFIARVAPDADSELITTAFDEIARATAEGEDGAGWSHQVVVADDWLAFNAVPPPLAVEDVPQDLLASDRTYQWVRRGFIQNGSNVYVNLEALEKAILGPLASSDELAAVRPLRALGISSQTEAAGDAHAHMTVLIVSE